MNSNRNTQRSTNPPFLIQQAMPLARTLPLNQPIHLPPVDTTKIMQESAQRAFDRLVETLLEMERDGLISKSQIAQILFETSKLTGAKKYV